VEGTDSDSDSANRATFFSFERSAGDCLKLDYLFIDTHPDLNEQTLISIDISNVLLVILRPDSQDFQGTAVTVDVARKLEIPKMLMVVNKALLAFDFADLPKQVQTTYNVSVAGILPLCEEMVQLGSKGIFCLRYSEHPISQTIKGIAEQIVGASLNIRKVLMAGDRL
jgi:MinD-like ATPase involved in chromosome partitioning or flagellar assembly